MTHLKTENVKEFAIFHKESYEYRIPKRLWLFVHIWEILPTIQQYELFGFVMLRSKCSQLGKLVCYGTNKLRYAPIIPLVWNVFHYQFMISSIKRRKQYSSTSPATLQILLGHFCFAYYCIQSVTFTRIFKILTHQYVLRLLIYKMVFWLQFSF